MKTIAQKLRSCPVSLLLALMLWTLGAQQTSAFSLLGPYAPWMDVRKGYRVPGLDAATGGGPMNLGEEYRWNLPVVTYGFDQSFISYFGSNGVSAVEQAIQVLNDLPPASEMDPRDYKIDTRKVNPVAQNLLLLDLKSNTMSALLEQMGLASPERFVFTIRDINIVGQNPPTTNYTVAQRNFDPLTAQPSPYVNSNLYTYQLLDPAYLVNNVRVADAVEYRADTLTSPDPSSVASIYYSLYLGQFFEGLTYDDVGGLRYLLSAGNINAESLPDGLTAYGPNPNAFVKTALRPGVEKVTFVRVSYDSLLEMTPPFTNVFADTFYSNGVPRQQLLQRVVTRPDIVFSAADLGVSISGFPFTFSRDIPTWPNYAALNGDPDGLGPGIIQPGAKITFNKTAGAIVNNPPFFLDENNGFRTFTWGSFGTNETDVIIYPAGTPFPAPQNIFVRLENTDAGEQLHWRLWGTVHRTYSFESSTNLVDWNVVTNVFNSSGLMEFWRPAPPSTSRMFYRARPQ